MRVGFRCVAMFETVGTKTINLSCYCFVNCCVESDMVIGTGV